MTIPAAILAGGTDIVARDNGTRSAAVGSGPVERIALARPELPCGGCAHAAVCAIRPLLDVDALSLRAPASPHEAIRIIPALTVTCAHFLAGKATVVEAARPLASDPSARFASIAESRRRGAEAHVRAVAAAKPAERKAYGSGKAARAQRAQAVIAALREHPDDRAAARRASGLRGPAFAMVVRSLQLKGELPADLAEASA